MYAYMCYTYIHTNTHIVCRGQDSPELHHRRLSFPFQMQLHDHSASKTVSQCAKVSVNQVCVHAARLSISAPCHMYTRSSTVCSCVCMQICMYTYMQLVRCCRQAGIIGFVFTLLSKARHPGDSARQQARLSHDWKRQKKNFIRKQKQKKYIYIYIYIHIHIHM